MSDVFEWLKLGSLGHDARLGDNGETLVITPVGGREDEASLAAFQPIAQAVLQGESEGQIRIITKHMRSRVSGNLYDHFILSRA
jgi:hypothetical protein